MYDWQWDKSSPKTKWRRCKIDNGTNLHLTPNDEDDKAFITDDM